MSVNGREAFPIKNKCADTVADVLVEKIILCFGMPLVIHSDQGREFGNERMKSLRTLLGYTKARTAPYRPEAACSAQRRSLPQDVSTSVLEVAYDHV